MNDLDFVASELKQYTINTLNLLGKEIDDQYDKWAKERTGFFALLCGAHGDAAKEQAKVLKQQQDEERRAFERAMFIFSILGVFAIDTVGAAIELKLAPKLIGEYEKVMVAGYGLMYSPTKSAGVGRKVMGDFSNDFMDLMSALGTKYDGPPFNYKELDLTSLPYKPNANDFAQKIYEELDRQRKSVMRYFNGLTQNINNSRVFGGDVVKKLLDMKETMNSIEKAVLHTRGKQPDTKAMIQAGQILIDSLLDEVRKKWVDAYYYYEYDPSPNPPWGMIKQRLERYLWKLWIQQQKFRIRVNEGMDPGWRASDSYTLVGASGSILAPSGGFASRRQDNPIVVRLFDLNAPVMDLLMHGSTWSHHAECQSQLDKLNKWATQLDTADAHASLEGVKRPWRTVSKIWL